MLNIVNFRFCLGNDSNVSDTYRRLSLNLISVPRLLFVSSFVRKCKLAVIASSNMCVLAVDAVILYG
jgi:hypothetical protein